MNKIADTDNPSGVNSILNFADFLEQRIASTKMKKGERTREKLKWATAKQLEINGYRDIRVTDIHDQAGVSNALFYVYFTNKQEICTEVLSEFVTTILPPSHSHETQLDKTIESIYAGHLAYTRIFASNPGLMRCLIQLGDDVPEFDRIWQDWNNRWTNRTIRNIIRHEELAISSDSEIVATVSALGLMVDAFLRNTFVDKNTLALDAYNGIGGTAESLALFFTNLWHKALFCKEMTWTPDNSD